MELLGSEKKFDDKSRYFETIPECHGRMGRQNCYSNIITVVFSTKCGRAMKATTKRHGIDNLTADMTVSVWCDCVTDGSWDCSDPDLVLSVSNSAAPVNRMLIVNGKLWCACLNDVIVLSVPALNVEV